MLEKYTHHLEILINSKMYFGFPCCPFLKMSSGQQYFLYAWLWLFQINNQSSCLEKLCRGLQSFFLGLGPWWSTGWHSRLAELTPLYSTKVESTNGFEMRNQPQDQKAQERPQGVSVSRDPYMCPESSAVVHLPWDYDPGWECLLSQDLLELCPCCWSSRPKRHLGLDLWGCSPFRHCWF